MTIPPQMFAETPRLARPRVIILGAGRPYRGENPSALVHTSRNRRALDWTLDAFSRTMEAEVHFVGGYRLQEIVQTYPHVFISVNPNWQNQGPLGSLLVAPLAAGQTTYVCYSDIVISIDTVRLLRDRAGDVVLVADRGWRHRYVARSTQDLVVAEKARIAGGKVIDLDPGIPVEEADAEFIGLLKLSPRAVDHLVVWRAQRRQELSRHGIPRLVREFIQAGLDVVSVEIDGGWAELNAPQDLARFVLGTKADTLERLRPLVRRSVIGDQVKFTVGEWQADRRQVLAAVGDKFGQQNLAVRSSALSEDNWTRSNAGTFATVLDVPGADHSRLASAVEEVAGSYGENNAPHQVLVQAMLTNVAVHGVVLTRTLNHGAPYYILNFDDTGAGTAAVTSGRGPHLRTVIVYRGHKSLPPAADGRLAPVMAAVKELEEHVGHDALDVEFAATGDWVVHVLQLRPIAVDHGRHQADDSAVDQALQAAAQVFLAKQQPSPPVLGKWTMFGIMPDWNPAEIIGPKPRRLSLSLYQYLVTDDVWSTQRAEYGYRDVRPHPLLVTFAGHPYVDVRACFNSFIPAGISDGVAERLVEHYLDFLKGQPHLHDKVEFAVAFTCLTFDFDQRAGRLRQAGFTDAEIAALRGALTRMTIEAPGHCQRQLKQIATLEQRFQGLMQAHLDPLARAFALLEDCRRWGTLPFAHLARGAFVATALLRSLEDTGTISGKESEDFLKSLETVAGRLEREGWEVAQGRLGWDELVKRYGHLRPGTYEVTCPSYAEEPERYLRPMVSARPEGSGAGAPCPHWDGKTRSRIDAAISALGFPWDVAVFEGFLREAIEGREYAKFVFSRNLSFALDELVKFAGNAGVGRDQLSHIGIRDLLGLHTGVPLGDIGTWLGQRAEEGAQWHLVAQAVELPPLLVHQNDLFAFEQPQSQPNFVTDRRVVAASVELGSAASGYPDLKGVIVLIPQADPGYDWLFGHNIAGLITMYGGANSHMTIRAAEFGLPAAIGVGQALYDQLSGGSVIELDCAAHWVRVVR